MQVISRQFSGVGSAGHVLPQQDAMLVASSTWLQVSQQSLLANAQLLADSLGSTSTSTSTRTSTAQLPLLLAVADGVSSSPMPATASRLLLQLLAQNWQAGLLTGTRLNSKQLRASQQQLTTKLAGKAASFGASSTIAALEVTAGGFKVINAGDSRVWRYRQGELLQLTVDHCYAAELTASSLQPLAQCYQALTSYIAADPDAEDFVVSVRDGAIEPGDQFLLTSDGIHDAIDPQALALCLAKGSAGVAALDALLGQTQFDDNASLIWLCW